MINNDILRSIRYMLDLSDGHVIEIIHLSDPTLAIDKAEVAGCLKREEDEGFRPLADLELAHFLEGLVIRRRGVNPTAVAREIEPRISNNLVLKKLRVAFELKDLDMHQTLESAGFPISKPELSALFRQSSHRNFRPCGDQLLRNFLKGLTLRVRGGSSAADG